MVKILLDATFSGISLIESFLRELIQRKFIRKSFVTFFFWSL